MIQDIYPHTLNNQFTIDIKPKADDYLLLYRGRNILLKDGKLPKVQDIDKSELIYLFSIDDARFFTCLDKIEGFFETDIRELSLDEQHLIYAVYTGKHLNDWYRTNRYCGCCGKPMVHASDERALYCSECHNRVYPRIMPAVIVGVRNGDEIVLTKYRTGFEHNALIAGFVEIGETVEQTVEREVMEEIGLKVKNIHYYKSQPWGTASDILMGYYCDVDGDTTIRMDNNELKMAKWTKREDIVLQPNNYSLTNEMMEMFKNHQDY